MPTQVYHSENTIENSILYLVVEYIYVTCTRILILLRHACVYWWGLEGQSRLYSGGGCVFVRISLITKIHFTNQINKICNHSLSFF